MGPPGVMTGGNSTGVPYPPTTGRRPGPRADVMAAIVTVLAGLLGVGQLFLSWTSVVFGVGLPADGGVTGWAVFRTAQAAASLTTESAIAAYSILGVGLAGGALVLLGLAMLAPINHRPLGVVGLVLSVLATGGALYWVVRAQTLTSQSLGGVFADAGPGWYLFLLAGVVGIIGTSKALATG